MASLTVILVVLWDRSPYVAVVLVGPLLVTALYQRWIHRSLERLRQFDRLKDEFIAVVSHELRTPLTSVYGAAMTLGRHELDEERRNALLRIVSTESERLARLLDDILTVSRLDSGRSEVAIAPVEPLELVSDVVDSAREHLPSERSIELSTAPAPPPVAADPDKLRQVLVNLIDNALKYGRRRPPVQRHRRGAGDPVQRADADLREVPPARPEHDARQGGNGPRPLHLPRARRPHGRAHLGGLRAGRRLYLQLRASGRRRHLIPPRGELAGRSGADVVPVPGPRQGVPECRCPLA